MVAQWGCLCYTPIHGRAAGFCGCLTTVSTFIVELSTLSLIPSYVYAFTSVAVAQVGMIAIGGTLQWTSA